MSKIISILYVATHNFLLPYMIVVCSMRIFSSFKNENFFTRKTLKGFICLINFLLLYFLTGK